MKATLYCSSALYDITAQKEQILSYMMGEKFILLLLSDGKHNPWKVLPSNNKVDTQRELEITMGLVYMFSELVNNVILGFALNCSADFQQTMKSYF